MNREFLETIKIDDGVIYNLSYHQRRYEAVLSAFGIDRIKQLKDFIQTPLQGLYRCRILYDTNHIISVTYHPYTKKKVKSLKLIFDDSIEYKYKYASRGKINLLYQNRSTCDDILIIKNSLVTDTSIANIAFLKDGIWRTPKSPLLKGTTRTRLLEEGVIIEEDIGVEEINSFSQIALMNAMIDFDILESCEFLL